MRKSEIEGENQRHGEKKSLIETEILVERDREMTERQIERLNGESKVRNIPGINNSGLGYDLRNAGHFWKLGMASEGSLT